MKVLDILNELFPNLKVRKRWRPDSGYPADPDTGHWEWTVGNIEVLKSKEELVVWTKGTERRFNLNNPRSLEHFKNWVVAWQ